MTPERIAELRKRVNDYCGCEECGAQDLTQDLTEALDALDAARNDAEEIARREADEACDLLEAERVRSARYREALAALLDRQPTWDADPEDPENCRCKGCIGDAECLAAARAALKENP